MNILGVPSSIYMWHKRGNEEMSGAQIDMIIDRDDNVMHFCEMKYYKEPIILTKEIATNIKNKISSFKYHEKSNKNCFITIIAPYGIKPNIHSTTLVNHVVTLNELFRETFTIY